MTNKFVLFLFAMVLLGVGSVLIPPIKDVSTAIFEAFGTEDMPPFLKLIVDFWPIFLLAIFFFGAYCIIRSRGGE